MMNSVFLAVLLAASAQSAPAAPSQSPQAQLSQEHRAMLRCSAAFALVSFGQANQNEAAMAWPAIDPRGREFFVRSLAKIMDATGLSRDQVAELTQAEAQRLIDNDTLEDVMPGCLLMLDASGV